MLPTVDGRYPFHDHKHGPAFRDAYDRPARYEGITVPKNSMAGMAVGLGGAVAAFGLIWHMWWLASIGLGAVVAAVLLRSFGRDDHRVIPAAEVERADRRWRDAVDAAKPVRREQETTPANRGRARILDVRAST